MPYKLDVLTDLALILCKHAFWFPSGLQSCILVLFWLTRLQVSLHGNHAVLPNLFLQGHRSMSSRSCWWEPRSAVTRIDATRYISYQAPSIAYVTGTWDSQTCHPSKTSMISSTGTDERQAWHAVHISNSSLVPVHLARQTRDRAAKHQRAPNGNLLHHVLPLICAA